MSSQSHLDEKSFEQLLAAAFALQQQQRGPVLVPSKGAPVVNAMEASVHGSSRQRKGVRAATANASANARAHAHVQERPVPSDTALSSADSGSAMSTSPGPAFSKSAPEAEEATRLAAIAETQTAVHSQPLSLQEAVQMLVARAAAITQGSGAAIWLIQDGRAVCRAVCGNCTDAVGQRMETATGRLAPCLHGGEVVRVEAAPGAETPRLAVPIHHDGRVQGALEIVFQRWRRFRDADLRTSQILSGLVSEAITLAEGQQWKHVLDSERATLLEALDRIQPHLSRLLSEVDGAAADVAHAIPDASEPSRSRSMARLGEYLLTQKDVESETTATLGAEHPPLAVEPEEGEFAGEFSGDPEEAWLQDATPPASTQDWQARDQRLQGRAPREVHTALNLSVSPAARAPQGAESPWRDGDGDGCEIDRAQPVSANSASGRNAAPAMNRYTRLLTASAARPVPDDDLPDDSAEPAAKPSEMVLNSEIDSEIKDAPLPALVPERGFLAQRWADICLAVSVLILFSSLVWALWPNAAHAAPGTRSAAKSAAQPSLTWFEQMLVSVGLAEAPAPAAVYMGAPDVQVWVDLQTAQYYCNGAEGYGKTAKGKFLAQHDAQYQQFQSARGRPCD